jgi:hypothetical protein
MRILLFITLFTDFILYIYNFIKDKIYNRIEKFVSRIIWNFYFNLEHDGLLTAINKFLFDLYNILVPKSKLQILSLLFFCYLLLPFCTQRAYSELLNLNIVKLLDMTCSIQDYLGLVILTYTIFIVILNLSICYISCNKQLKKFFPLLNLIINLALFLALVILMCIFLLLLFLLFDKIVEIFIKCISEYIIKMLTSNPGPRGSGTGQPGGFGKPAGGGGKPPKKPGGFSPGKAHYKDRNDTDEDLSDKDRNDTDEDLSDKDRNDIDEDLSDEESKKREAQKAKERNYRANYRANLSQEQREANLAKSRINYANKVANETNEEKDIRLAKKRVYGAKSRANLSEAQRVANSARGRKNHAKLVANETNEERRARLIRRRISNAKAKAKKAEGKKGDTS